MIRLIFILLISIYTFQLWGQTKGEWIVQYFNVSNSFHEKSNNEYQLLSSSLSIYLVNDSETLSKSEASELFSEHGKIKHLFRNQEVYPRTYIPDDELYFEQWNMDVINAPNVWEETTGGRSETGEEIVMAVLDDGYDINHIELRNNLWINPNELPGDGIDNDGNGYIDDHQGVNIEDKNDIHPESDHGTQVVGIMAAQGDNNTGIAGMNWNTKVLFVSGVSNVGEIITGYEYVYDLKKRYLESDGTDGANIVVTNLSSGLEFAFPSQLPSWCEIYDLLGSVGVLSVCATANLDVNIEIEGDMPTLCTSDYLIMVTNTDTFDEKVQYAAQNKTHVDLGAPGELITTLDIKNEYSRISGTSASTPHVAGAVALFFTIPCQSLTDLIKINPTAAALTIKNAILNGTAPNVTLDETV
ncbi:MAG: S8 family serine peptidase, partial [Saprospiraceae bacterium]|nr:S8 family serine peptidase [Saprospiraceae bacterium]